MSGRPTTAQRVMDWATELDTVGERIGRRFARSEPRLRAVGYIRGLLSQTERKNGWQLFAALRTFRESREVQSLEGRFRHLLPLLEALASRPGEELRGPELYRRIARVAWFSMRDDWDDDIPLRHGRWRSWHQLAGDVSGLWGRIRNPLAHSCRVMRDLSRDPIRDLMTAETLAISMIRALGRACFESGATERDVYDILTGIAGDDLPDIDPEPRGGRERPEGGPRNSVRQAQNNLARDTYGQTLDEAQQEGACIRCRSPQVNPADFRDDASHREFQISGFCQHCQDQVFGDP